MILIFMFVGFNDIIFPLLSISFIPLLATLIYNLFISNINFNYIKEISISNIKYIIEKNFQKYTIYDLSKIPISYFKTNIVSLISPLLFSKDLIFIFVFVSKIFTGTVTVLSKTAEGLLIEKEYKKIKAFSIH